MSGASSSRRPDGADPGIVTTRLLDADPATAFRAFADPELLAKWWGPEGFVNDFEEFDLRPGGAWRFAMRGPDGTEYRMDKRFVEVIPEERVVLRHLDPTHGFLMEMRFEAEGAGTRITWRMNFESAEEEARVREAVIRANEENLDRLEALLAAL